MSVRYFVCSGKITLRINAHGAKHNKHRGTNNGTGTSIDLKSPRSTPHCTSRTPCDRSARRGTASAIEAWRGPSYMCILKMYINIFTYICICTDSCTYHSKKIHAHINTDIYLCTLHAHIGTWTWHIKYICTRVRQITNKWLYTQKYINTRTNVQNKTTWSWNKCSCKRNADVDGQKNDKQDHHPLKHSVPWND